MEQLFMSAAHCDVPFWAVPDIDVTPICESASAKFDCRTIQIFVCACDGVVFVFGSELFLPTSWAVTPASDVIWFHQLLPGIWNSVLGNASDRSIWTSQAGTPTCSIVSQGHFLWGILGRLTWG